MGTFLAILILLFVWVFMISPFIRLWKTSKQWRDAYQNAQEKAREQYQRSRDRQQNARQSERRPKKKIDPTVGEYVEFTETTVSAQETATDGKETSRTTVTESQITDVSWEELPEK